MHEETRIALHNYAWLVQTHGPEEVALVWELDTLSYGTRAVRLESLCERGFTPATR